jgi:hypothetical protein
MHAAQIEVEHLQARVHALEECVRLAASHFRAMAEGYERNREPSRAAACQGMAELMEDRL